MKIRSTNVFQQPSHITRKKRGESDDGEDEKASKPKRKAPAKKKKNVDPEHVKIWEGDDLDIP